MCRHVSKYWLFIATTMGWSGIGHDEIGRIAVSNFQSSNTTLFLNDLFESRNVPSFMSGRWADEISDSRPWSKRLHFFNTPYRQCSLSFDKSRDCISGCIVTAIGNYTAIAIDPMTSKSERQEAVKFLIHFLGDIHCPMHGGFAKDSGGNGIAISGIDARYPPTLHSVWDYHIVVKVFDGQRDGLISEPVSSNDTSSIDLSDISNFVSTIASETSSIACSKAYMHSNNTWIEDGDILGNEYWNSMTIVASNQLNKAGIRLARLLDAIADANLINKSADSCSMLAVLVVVVCVLLLVH
jgi:hypothetical protein